MNWDLASQILKDAESVIQRLSGDEGIFTKTQQIVSCLAESHTCTEADLDDYEAYLKTLRLNHDGHTVQGEIFGDSALKIQVLDKDNGLVAGIEIDGENGGKLTGRWIS